MPWCDNCSAYRAPTALDRDGTCPACGGAVAKDSYADKIVEDKTETKAGIPWHFWVMLVALAIYLGWRLIQGIGWVIQQF